MFGTPLASSAVTSEGAGMWARTPPEYENAPGHVLPLGTLASVTVKMYIPSSGRIAGFGAGLGTGAPRRAARIWAAEPRNAEQSAWPMTPATMTVWENWTMTGVLPP